MATKPTVADAEWASDETNNTAPSAGQRNTGWTANQIAVSSYFNQLAYEYYKWALYLSDGALTGNHTIAGTLGVTGAVDFDSSLNCDGAAVIDGTLDVGGLITATDGISVGTNQSVTVLGTGKYKYGSKTKIIPACAGYPGTGAIITVPPAARIGYLAVSGADTVIIPIEMTIGERITGISIHGYDSSAGSFVRGELYRYVAATEVTTQIGADLDSTTGGTGAYAVAITGLTEDVATGESFFLLWTSGAGGDVISHIEVICQNP